jgi:hypothetical protein
LYFFFLFFIFFYFFCFYFFFLFYFFLSSMALQRAWALAPSILCLQVSQSSADLLQFLPINFLLSTLITATNRLPLGLLPSITLSVLPWAAQHFSFSSHDPPTTFFPI